MSARPGKYTANKGQSLVEVIFAAGVVVITLSGIAMLLVKSLSSRTRMFDQKKATELGQVAVEKMVQEKRDYPNQFWDPASSFWVNNNGTTQTDTNYPQYFYVITARIGNDPGCTINPITCLVANVKVGWSGNEGYEIKLNRFFTRR